jgi:hypothetical protein
MLPKTGEPLRRSFRYRFTGTNTGAFVLNKEHDRFRWFSIACVPANDRNPSGLFCQANSEPHRPVLLRHDDLSALAFQGRDEALRIGLEERERAVMARDDGFELEVPLHG